VSRNREDGGSERPKSPDSSGSARRGPFSDVPHGEASRLDEVDRLLEASLSHVLPRSERASLQASISSCNA